METTRPATPLGPAARAHAVVLRPLHPRVRLLWWAQGAMTVLVLTAVALVVDLVVLERLSPRPVPAMVLPGVVLVAGGLLASAVPPLRYRRWRYALRPGDLWIRYGVAWVTVSVIPFSRLQFVDTRQGPLERLFGVASLVVHTAAPGTSGTLPGLDSGEAERLRERLAEVEVDRVGL